MMGYGLFCACSQRPGSDGVVVWTRSSMVSAGQKERAEVVVADGAVCHAHFAVARGVTPAVIK